MTTFTKWLDTFIVEKGIDTDAVITVDGASGPNHIPVECLLDAIKGAPTNEQRGIRDMIVRIDFRNGDVMDYFRHLAKAIAI